MQIDLGELSPSATYFNMIQTLIPRPIAWVLSENADSSLNLAPFSYFSAVCSDPPLLMISLGKKPDGSAKDTRANIEARGHFVIQIPSMGLLEAMNESSMTLPAGESELDRLQLATEPFAGSALPRLKDAPIAYACELYELHEVGNTPQALIIGKVTQLYIDDRVATQDAKGRLKVDAAKVDPVARLGASEYAKLGDIIRLQRPA
ncbi:flavin reductase family protein [Motiliproteus sp. SC1-56]|uniref:flavin reductase family protein n=1 Tax=Motiliproteus sp. SC1-56 TaxID=2799565 RepID=UPI001A8C71A5|nr:flavin reductase family protein [Motiliproteus sp. SC1-56]